MKQLTIKEINNMSVEEITRYYEKLHKENAKS